MRGFAIVWRIKLWNVTEDCEIWCTVDNIVLVKQFKSIQFKWTKNWHIYRKSEFIHIFARSIAFGLRYEIGTRYFINKVGINC